MNRMQALIIAALLTGFLSLAGLGYILYSTYTNPGTNTEPTSVNHRIEAPAPQEAETETEEVKPEVPVIPPPSITVMRKNSYALPGFSALKQVSISFPTIKRQVARYQEEKRIKEAQAQKELDALEQSFLLDVEPPANEPPITEKSTPSIERKSEEIKPPVEKKEVKAQQSPAAARPINEQAEKAILEMAAKTQKDENKKQQMLQSGGRLPVREIRKRFDGTLTDQQLSAVLNDIFGEKGENDNDATCVTINSLPETSVTASQLSSYLIGKGFIMAGRGEANPKVKGIKVDASGRCIVVSIGKIE